MGLDKTYKEKYRALVENAPDGIFLLDDKGNYLEVNSAACSAFGYTREEFLRMSIRDLVSPGQEIRIFPTILEHGYARGEGILKRKDGSLMPVELHGAKLSLEGRTVVLGIHRDLTDRKAPEHDLQAAHQTLLEGSHLHIRSLAAAAEARDPSTRGHQDRVRDYSLQLARRLNLSQKEMENVANAAELHDLGKLYTPDSILLKAGPLDPPERAEMRRHPERGAELVLHIPFLRGALPIIRGHHERYDGAGYPDGLAGEAIPLGSRILTVVDAYDSMTSDRPYRPALSHKEAVRRLREGAGSQFDPRVLAIFLEVLGELNTQQCEGLQEPLSSPPHQTPLS